MLMIASIISPIFQSEPAFATGVSTGVASVYIDAPFVQGSYARHHGGVTETFDSLGSSNPTQYNANSSLQVGRISAGTLNTYGNDGTYGASTSTETPTTTTGNRTRFSSTQNSTGFTINFSNSVKYVGFHWQAGNAGNVVEFRSSNIVIASLTTDSITALVGLNPAPAGNGANPRISTTYANYSDSLTATSGAKYLKKYYWGPPSAYSTSTPTQVEGWSEPYAYVHAFALNDESFDSIRIYTTSGGFEMDNLTVSTQEVPIRSSLVLSQTVNTNLTLGTSAWNFKGVTTSDSSSVSTGWQSDSLTATTSPQISIQQDLSISSGTINMGATALFRATLTDSGGITCGSYSLVETYTATDAAWLDITIADSGSSSRTRLVRGNCYAWTLLPTSDYGSGAVRPTSSAANTRFNQNLDSPRLILPRLPDVKIPKTIPADPTRLQLSFPGTKVTQGPGQMQVCLFETSLSTLTGWGTSTGTQNLRFSSGSSNDSPLIATSTIAIQNLFDNLRIQRINSTRFSVNRYVLVRLVPYLGTGFTTDCSGSGSGDSVTFSGNLWPRQSDTFLIHLKPINLTQTRTLYVPLKNGRQP